MNEVMLTEKQQAEALHKQITGYGEVIYQSLYGMCTAIKQMRDSKLYRALGYDTFEAYTEEKLGMKRSQAYCYVSIAEKLNEDFVQSTGQIGIQKLYLLAMAPEETRTEITETVDLESVTVRELQAQLNALRKEKQTAEAAVTEAKEAQALLEAQVRELESRPVEVAIQESQELEQLKANMEDVERRSAEQITALHQQHTAELVAIKEEHAKQLKQAQAVSPDDAEAVFNAYLAIALDASNRLLQFLNDHPNDRNAQKVKRLCNMVINKVEVQYAG